MRIASVLNPRSCLRSLTVAAALVGSIALLALLAHDTFGFWLQRMALSPQEWPRTVRLEVVGFPRDAEGRRVATMARHDDFELLVTADLTQDFVAPDRVQIRFRLPDGRRGRDYLTRVGNAAATGENEQRYRYQFKNVREELTFDVHGGDDRVRDLHLRVVDRPELTNLEIECHYPEYLGRGPSTLPFTRGMRIPRGSRLIVHAEASKPISATHVRSEQHEREFTQSFDDRSTVDFQFEYGLLTGDDALLVNFTDEYGISAREPYRVSLSAIPDELPQVAVQLEGIGTAVTPQAMIPLAGDVTDDYGLADLWIRYSANDGPTQRLPTTQEYSGQTAVETHEVFDLRDQLQDAAGNHFVLAEGQQLAISVAASDRCTLDEGLRIGHSQRFLLEVVSPSDLLMMIERRELTYRQQFEAIYEKMTDTRGLLARVEFSDGTADAASDENGPNGQRTAVLRRLRVAGARQNVVQAADEVLGLAEGFEHLHDQLINNRIEDDALKSRLKQQIALPLFEIAKSMMPDLESQLQLTEANLDDAEAASASLDEALVKTDRLLVAMREVLDRMLELETYNEVVALLRGIITDQDQLHDRTNERRKQSLRGLLEE